MYKKGFLCFSLIGAAVLAGLDQAIKAWAKEFLAAVPDIKVIPGVLHLLYRENYGAAFSILQNKTALLVTVTSVVLIGLLVLLLMRKVTHPAMVGAFSLILAGGAGNLIDRITRGFVVDYIYFVPIDFPVFNLADCCVVAGTGLVVLYILLIEPRMEKEKRSRASGGGPEDPGGETDR